jgi:hypothetical protein
MNLVIATSKSFVPIPREAWETMWKRLREEGARMSLNDYARHCDRVKKSWANRWGPWRFDNGRYAVHVEEQLQRGFPYPGDVMQSDLQFDAPAFPHILKAWAARAEKRA